MVLNITVPAGMVDINVHPRKSEVKFSDDKIIFKAVYHGILNALNNPLHERYERESSVYMGISESLSKDSSNTPNTAINQGDDNTNISHGNSTYDSYRTPPVVHDLSLIHILLKPLNCLDQLGFLKWLAPLLNLALHHY